MSAIALEEATARVKTALGEGRLGEAERLLAGVRRIVPEAVGVQRLWGKLLLEKGEFQAGERVLARVVEVDPEDAEAWTLLAEARRARGDRDGARVLLQVAWECAPWRRDLRERLAAWCEEDGRAGVFTPTAAALSAWYGAQGWWARVADECRALLEQLTDRWDLEQRLCLALWWQGAQQEAAMEAARLLERRPELIGAVIVALFDAATRGDAAAVRRHRELLWALDPLGEVVARVISSERLVEREWLGAPTPILVEEPGEVPVSEEVALLWELPSDEELAAARPSSGTGAELLAVGEGGDLGCVEFESGTREEVREVLSLPSMEELEEARPREELRPGWTGLLVELEETGLRPLQLEELGALAQGMTEEKAGAASGEEVEEVRTVEEGFVSVRKLEEAVAPAGAVVSEEGELRTAIGGEMEESSVEHVAEEGVEGVRRLIVRGATRDAVRLAQRIVHGGGSGVEEVVQLLDQIVKERQAGAREAAMVLGAWYRRRGEKGLAARYYELALRLRSE